ncbi:MFS transporter [candidate division KSB1 bacterium]|nr:MFS transporter [candidate division KSB1 bacterium]
MRKSDNNSKTGNSTGQAESRSPLIRDRNLHIIFAVTMMAVMGVSSVTPAFPQIADRFALSSRQIGYLISMFTLPGILMTPVLGVLADRWGRRRILVPSLFLFALAGSACALAQDFTTLLVWRFLQGIGAAALGSLYAVLIGDIYHGADRGRAMGYNAGVLSVGTAGYPAIGGGLALLGWNYPFLLPLFALPVAIIVLLALKNPEPVSRPVLGDYFRDLRRSIGARAAGLFFLSIALFVLLYGAYLTYLPLLMADRFGSSSLTIGITLSAMSLVTALVSSFAGRLMKRFSDRRLLFSGFLSYAVALSLFAFADTPAALVPPIVIFGIGHGINFPTIQTLLVNLAPIQFRAAFMALNGMLLRLGQTLGPLVSAPVFAWGGMAAVYCTAAGVAILSALFAALLPRS